MKPVSPSRPSPWVVIPRPDPGARLRLFCFPYAGGGASIYTPWGRMMPPEVEVVAVQLPGRENRIGEPAVASLRELTPRVAEGLAPFMDRPFAFFGHSMGGLIAFDLARKLRREGRPGPLHLFVSARPAPQAAFTLRRMHDLPRDEFIEGLRRYNSTPEEVLQNEELMQLVTPTLRADFSVSETPPYTPEPPLETPISAFGGVDDDDVPVWTVEAWREQAAGEFRVVTFPGGHFFVNELRDRVVAEVTADLRRALARAGAHPAHA